MRVAVASLLIVAGLAGCFGGDSPEPDPGPGDGMDDPGDGMDGTSTQTSTQTDGGDTVMGPSCTIWIEDIEGVVLRGGVGNQNPAWNVLLGIDGAPNHGATVTVETIQIDFGTPRLGSEQTKTHTSSDDAEITFTRPTGSGLGHYRMTVVGVEHSNADGPCFYDEARNNAISDEISLQG